MIEVELVGPLAELAGGRNILSLQDPATVIAALKHLTDLHPELIKRCFIGEHLSKRVVVYVDDVDIRLLQGEATKLISGSRIRILTALAGG